MSLMLVMASGASAAREGPTGPTGPTGLTGPTGPTGPAGQVCTTLGVSPNDVTNCFLKPKFAETGGWSAHISVPLGGPQAESDGVVSFNPKYPLEPSTLKLNYRNEAEALAPKLPCVGSVNEPQAERGNLCVYRGVTFGKEAQDKDIREPNAAGNTEGFRTAFGEAIASGGECNKESGNCQSAVMVVFRTNQFAEPATTTVTEFAYLDTRGTWAVTAN
jgi:hypothetical protein